MNKCSRRLPVRMAQSSLHCQLAAPPTSRIQMSPKDSKVSGRVTSYTNITPWAPR